MKKLTNKNWWLSILVFTVMLLPVSTNAQFPLVNPAEYIDGDWYPAGTAGAADHEANTWSISVENWTRVYEYTTFGNTWTTEQTVTRRTDGSYAYSTTVTPPIGAPSTDTNSFFYQEGKWTRICGTVGVNSTSEMVSTSYRIDHAITRAAVDGINRTRSPYTVKIYLDIDEVMGNCTLPPPATAPLTLSTTYTKNSSKYWTPPAGSGFYEIKNVSSGQNP